MIQSDAAASDESTAIISDYRLDQSSSPWWLRAGMVQTAKKKKERTLSLPSVEVAD